MTEDYEYDHGYGEMHDMILQFVDGLSGKETHDELERLIDDAAFQIHQCVQTMPLECIRDEIVNSVYK